MGPDMKRSSHRFALLSALLLLAPVAMAADLAAIQQRGSLRIGVSLFAPWTSQDADGALEGFEIEVGKRVAQAMGVDPEFKVYVWDEIIAGLERDEIDMIAAGMSITPFRALRVDFSDPYSEAGFTVVVKTSAVPDAVEDIRALDRDDYVIAIVSETLSAQAAPLFFDHAMLEVFPSPQDAEAAVLSGSADGYLTSSPEAAILVSQYSDRLRVPLAEPLAGAPAGFAVARGNETLLSFLNQWIRGSEQQAWLAATYGDWFGGSD